MSGHLSMAHVRDDTGDAARVLVDRLWPRGVSHEVAHLDLWAKHLAPSTELRKWYGHEADRWDDFEHRYTAELDAGGAELEQDAETVLGLLAKGDVALLTATKDLHLAHTRVLQPWLESRRSQR